MNKLILSAALLLAAAGAAYAEKADTYKPTNVDYDEMKIDDVAQTRTFIGNVVLTRGTLLMKADKAVVTEDPEGYQHVVMTSDGGKPATFRQKRDGEDEYSEGDSTRIEYDSAANRVRFVGAAHLRMLKGTVVTDQANAALITYDTATDTIKLGSGEGTAASSASGGRTTVVFTPKAAASSPRAVAPLKLDAPIPAPAAASGSTK